MVTNIEDLAEGTLTVSYDPKVLEFRQAFEGEFLKREGTATVVTAANPATGTVVVQLARAKDLVGEMLVFPADVAYVQVEPSETDGEWLFECIIETEKAREVAYHFVMAHEYDDGEHRREEKWTH